MPGSQEKDKEETDEAGHGEVYPTNITAAVRLYYTLRKHLASSTGTDQCPHTISHPIPSRRRVMRVARLAPRCRRPASVGLLLHGGHQHEWRDAPNGHCGNFNLIAVLYPVEREKENK